MTMTATQPVLPATASQGQAKITKDVQQRVKTAIAEMQADIFERDSLIHNMWVTRVGQLHLVQIGPGGIAKSFSARRMTQHIEGSVYFEKTLDPSTDPSQLYGPPNIKRMVEDGGTEFVTRGKLPEATDAMLDEFFNGNTPILQSLQPLLNERLFDNNHGGKPSRIPLRSCFMGTNKLNADVELAWLWDRVHVRELVDDIQDRNNSMAMVASAIARMASTGRGTSTTLPGQQLTTVTLEELDQAHVEALSLNVPDQVVQEFYDIRDELRQGDAQVRISPRREVESMVAVLANAWVRGHEEVTVADLDILASMWWTVQDQRAEVRKVILEATNPGEKAALDLLDELDKVKEELAAASKPDVDDRKKKNIGVEQMKNLERLEAEATEQLDKTKAAGLSTTRLEEVLGKTHAVKVQMARDIFGIAVPQQQNLANAASV